MDRAGSEATTLRLTRDFSADTERVFDAFLDAEILQAIWSADAYTIVEMKVEPRIGGFWSLAMRDESTAEIARCQARFESIDRPRRIVWWTKWQDGPMSAVPEMRVTLVFEALGSSTRLHLTHEFFPDSETRGHHASGWGSGLDRLARLLEGESAPQSPNGTTP